MSLRHLAAAVVVLAALTLSACGSGDDSEAQFATSAGSGDPVERLAPEEYAAWLAESPDVPLINVHVPYEGHLEGTDAFVPFDEVLGSEEFPADQSAPVAIYCRSGNMSATASEELVAAGYETIIDLDGGMVAWAGAGYELVEDPP